MRKTLNLGITIMQNADFNPIIFVPSTLGVGQDLTGYSFIGQIKESTSDAESVADFTFTILDQTTNTGQVRWFLSAADANAIPATPGTGGNGCRQTTPYLYDVLMIDTLGVKTRILQGPAVVSPNVSAAP